MQQTDFRNVDRNWSIMTIFLSGLLYRRTCFDITQVDEIYLYHKIYGSISSKSYTLTNFTFKIICKQSILFLVSIHLAGILGIYKRETCPFSVVLFYSMLLLNFGSMCLFCTY